MKQITLLFAMLLLANFTYSQDSYKRISINNVTPQTIQTLQDEGIDLTCGVIMTDDYIQMEVNDYTLSSLTNRGINYDVLIHDMQEFYSQRAIEDLPNASAELQHIKASQQNQRSYSVNEILNNVGQHDACDEIDWVVPSQWSLNDAANYPTETNHFGGCLTYDMVLQELDDMQTAYPGLISLKLDASLVSGEVDIPANKQTTVEGRSVYYVRISDNPGTDEAGEPETLYQSLIHSREASTVMNQLFFMWYLLENYDTDPAIKNLLNNQALYFIPVLNPDGFVYNQTAAPNGGGGQRKNRNGSGCGTYTNGIDLNRNSEYFWNNGGSSNSACNDTYMGSGPFSENETQIMRDFFLDHDFELALNHHSYKNAMLHAYAGVDRIPGTSTPFPNSRADEYSKYNHDMTEYNRYAHGPSTYISSLNSGNMNDWMLGGADYTYTTNQAPIVSRQSGTGSGKNTMAWTPENGLYAEGTGSGYGGFWPQPSNYLPIAKRAMRMNFLAAYFSGKYAKLHDLNQGDLTTLSGNLNFAVERLGQANGDFTVTVTPVSANILTVGGPSTQTGMAVLQQNNVNISYTLDPSIQPNDKIEFKVTLTNDYAADNVLYEANIIKQYTPTVLFEDDPDTDNLTNWTQTGTWHTTPDAYSGTKALRTSASAPYINNANKLLQMNGTVDLTNIPTALIQFYAKWDLERSFDYVTIEGSTNGTSWTPLCGKLTKPGAPTANNTYSGTSGGIDTTPKSTASKSNQNGISALYDGDTQDKWNMEEIVIDASTNNFLFNQATVYLRFRFDTDANNRQDSYVNVDFEGFFFDDFKVLNIQVPCEANVPTGLNASAETAADALIGWDNIPLATYDLRYKEISSGTWIDVLDLTTNSYTITGLTVSTDYEVQVRSKCGTTTSAFTTSVNFSTIALSYCNSGSGSTADEYISYVTLGTIDNTSTDGAGGYQDFTGSPTGTQTTDLDKNTTHTISVTKFWTGGLFNEAITAWIDFNKNGVFEASEKIINTPSNQTTPESNTFSIPASAVLGTTRMRVAMDYDNGTTYTVEDPCATHDFGEVEDYTVTITDATLSNPSVELTGVDVYPNPFSTALIMTIPANLVGTNFDVTLFDLSGRKILHSNRILRDQKIVIPNVAQLSTGTYFLRITNNNLSITKKLVKL